MGPTPRRHEQGGRDRSGWGAERRGRPTTTASEREAVRAWFTGSLVDDWFNGPPELTVDDYEILVVGELPGVELETDSKDARQVAEAARVERFWNDTRARRIDIATDAESRFARKVSWGARCGGAERLFTTASVPVMTRLNMAQRNTLDTLVDGGVARSRSEALAWCVELVGRNETDWIDRLRSALNAVEQERSNGPAAGS